MNLKFLVTYTNSASGLIINKPALSSIQQQALAPLSQYDHHQQMVENSHFENEGKLIGIYFFIIFPHIWFSFLLNVSLLLHSIWFFYLNFILLAFVVHKSRGITTLSSMHMQQQDPLMPARLRQAKEKQNIETKADERGLFVFWVLLFLFHFSFAIYLNSS